jgi:tRNA 5-methylaminomethyl-2-thiouridine biosynthesis bifunctional protein
MQYQLYLMSKSCGIKTDLEEKHCSNNTNINAKPDITLSNFPGYKKKLLIDVTTANSLCDTYSKKNRIPPGYAVTLKEKAKNNKYQQNEMITEAENLIIANATDAQKFQQTSHCEMLSVRGQVTLMPALGSSTALQTVICTDGYLSPARKGQHCIGATFSPNDTRTDIRVEDHQSNLNMLKSLAPEWGKINYDLPSLQGRASIRATTNDYLPLAGAILDVIKIKESPPRYNTLSSDLPWLEGLYINAGHGAKGLANAPLCAEIIASMICQEPAPVSDSLLSGLDPNRFALRRLGLKRLSQTIQNN